MATINVFFKYDLLYRNHFSLVSLAVDVFVYIFTIFINFCGYTTKGISASAERNPISKNDWRPHSK